MTCFMRSTGPSDPQSLRHSRLHMVVHLACALHSSPARCFRRRVIKAASREKGLQAD